MQLRKPVMHKPCVEVNRLANPSECLVQVYGFSTIFRIPPRRTAVLHGWDRPYSGLNMRRAWFQSSGSNGRTSSPLMFLTIPAIS